MAKTKKKVDLTWREAKKEKGAVYGSLQLHQPSTIIFHEEGKPDCKIWEVICTKCKCHTFVALSWVYNGTAECPRCKATSKE